MQQYNLGAVGLGHWFTRLYTGVSSNKSIRLLKAASTSGYEKKKEQLSQLGITKESYYPVASGEELPHDFFNDLNIVQISNPNQFHAQHTMQSLAFDKVTITEKTLGVNRQEFSNVLNYARDNSMEGKLYLHLHYLHKLLVLNLPGLLQKVTKKEGMITSSTATFFEAVSKEDRRRSGWLFSMESGGLFMDWIHPFEVYLKGAMAGTMDLTDAQNFVVNADYDPKNPTGVQAEVALAGKLFEDGATATIRIAKGVEEKQAMKMMRFNMESGSYLVLDFLDSEAEFTSKKRGGWQLYSKDGRLLESGTPTGSTSSEILVDDILAMCGGERRGLTTHEMQKIFEPQWTYQELYVDRPIKTGGDARRFIEEGIKTAK